jgi:hypothetical protein
VCRTRGLETQPGVAVGGQVHDHHVSGTAGSLELGHDATAMPPGASLPNTTGMTARDTQVGTDGHLVDPAYQAPLQGMVGTAAVPGRDNMTSVGTSLSSSDTGSGRPSLGPAVGMGDTAAVGVGGTAAAPGRDNFTSVGTSLSSSDIGSARPSSVSAQQAMPMLLRTCIAWGQIARVDRPVPRARRRGSWAR